MPTRTQAEKYELLMPLLESLRIEVKEFSKKKPDGALNKFKVAKINQILKDAKTLLAKEPNNEYLSLLDEETLPSNSDAVLTLGQFKASMEHFKEKYYTYDREIGKRDWQIE